MKRTPIFSLISALTITISCAKGNTITSKKDIKPNQAKATLEEHIKLDGTPKSNITLAQDTRIMLDFDRDIRAQGCDLEDDGDMLLFQWCTYDWDGDGPTFQCDITRQFIKIGADGDDGMTQLSFTFHFPPTAELERILSGNKWCDMPDELPEFEYFITQSAPDKALADTPPSKVEIHYGEV